MRKQVEQEASVGRHEAAAKPSREEALAGGREMEFPEQPSEVRGRRPLADEARRVPLYLVAPVHVRVAEAERPQRRVHPRGAGSRRAAQPHEQLVGGAVVGRDEHLAEEPVDASSSGRKASVDTKNLDRDRGLQRGGCWESQRRVPRCECAATKVAHEDACGSGKCVRERAQCPSEASVGPAPPRWSPRLRDTRKPKNRSYGRCCTPAVTVERGHRQRKIARRERHMEVERRPSAPQVAPRHHFAVDGHEEHVHAGSDPSRDAPKGDLSRCRRDEHWWDECCRQLATRGSRQPRG
jgi:hypothetical protein